GAELEGAELEGAELEGAERGGAELDAELEGAELVPRLWALVEDERVQLRPRSLPMRSAGERPRVSALSRFEAARLPFVTTPLHEHAPLDSFHAALVGHLDGQRTREEIVEALLLDIDAGRLRLASERVPPLEQLRPALARMLGAALQRLGMAGLLVG
ncbi:MAG: hypothetical protein KDK70_20455, partial [Myxococcales bacterium]|nr:hypothetical protein [Myxococcales bacterium]